MNNKIVILDANALMIPFQFGIDLEMEIQQLVGACKIIVPSSAMRELSSLSSHRAKGAIKLAERFDLYENEGEGDDAILKMAREMNGAVVTNDKELKRKLRKEKLPVIYLRGKNKLEMEGSV